MNLDDNDKPFAGSSHSMRSNGEDDRGPKIPIPGAAGASIYAALRSLALKPGDAQVVITKKRVPAGGYVYWVSNLTNPTS